MVLLTKAITEKIMVAFGHHNDANGNPIIPLDSEGNYMNPLIDALFDRVHPVDNEDTPFRGEVIGKHDDFEAFERTLEAIEEQPDLIRDNFLMNVRDAQGKNIFRKAVETDCYAITEILIDHDIMEYNMSFDDYVSYDMMELLQSHGLVAVLEEDEPENEEDQPDNDTHIEIG
jgi:hypothetical protein